MTVTYPRRTQPPGPAPYQYGGTSRGQSSTVRIRRPAANQHNTPPWGASSTIRVRGLAANQLDGSSRKPSYTGRVRTRSQDAIPEGAVAARVKVLSSISEPVPTDPAAAAPKRNREDSRSGFGRRMSRRFGNPAIQSTQPDENPRDNSRHSFLGLNPVRTNHDEEHGYASSSISYTRSPGINGQIDQSADTRRQNDAASPWGVLPRAKSVWDTSYGVNSRDLELGDHGLPVKKTFTFPSPPKRNAAETYRQQAKQRQSSYRDSEATIATTSTMRRQSVRDLFNDYGIQRPSGLASREVSRDFSEPRTGCHVCTCRNSRTSGTCSKCGRPVCGQCRGHPSRLPTTQEEEPVEQEKSSDKRREVRQSMPKPEEKRLEHDPVKQYQARPGPTPIQSRKGTHPTRKPSSPPVMFPEFYSMASPQRSPRKFPSVQGPHQEHRPVILGHRVTTTVRDSPFLMADLQSPRQSLRLFPAGMRGETHHTAHHHHDHHKNYTKQRRLINYESMAHSEGLSCGSQVRSVRATHQGHHLKKPRRTPDNTEIGYIADTSRVDDVVNSSSRCNSSLSRPCPRLVQQTGSWCSHHTNSSGPDSSQEQLKTDYSANCDIVEYIECRGYPRTGHARHGSPVGSGVVGECQHCLDDCLCEACQNTPHNVRCCTHTDHMHRIRVHHHPTSRKVVTVECSDEHVPQKASVQSRIPIASRSSTARHEYSSETCIKEEKKDVLTLPINLKEAPRPPSPPPLPVTRKETPKQEPTIEEKTEKTTESATQDTRPPSKENDPILQYAAHEDSSFEASAEPTDGTWFTIPSQHDHEHVHDRRSSCPPSENNSADQHRRSTEMTGAISPRTKTPSEKSVRKLSTASKEKKHSIVEALKEQLTNRKESQDTLKDHTEQINLPARNAVAELAQQIEAKSTKDTPYVVERTPSVYSSSKGSTTSKKKNWKLKLVDWSPGGRKKPGEEHSLSDDEIVSEKESYKALPSVSTGTGSDGMMAWSGESERKLEPGKGHNLSVDEVVMEEFLNKREKDEEHDCVWKTKFEALSKETGNQGLDIVGITVLVHLAGREDLVAKAENWTGGELKG